MCIFSQVRIMLTDRYLTQWRDRAAMSLISLISQLGGQLNLWCGITVIIVVEFIEFVFNLFATRKKKSPSNSHSMEMERCTPSSSQQNDVSQKNFNIYQKDYSHQYSAPTMI